MRANNRELRENASGCYDPTAYAALIKVNKEDERFRRLLGTIFYICDLAGFKVDGRIVLIDKRTGKVWR